MTDDEVDLKNLRRQIVHLERELALVMRHVPRAGRSDAVGHAISSQMWKCRCCNSLLGLYDPDDDTLRIRYKDHVTFVRAGGADIVGMAKAAIAAAAPWDVPPEAIEQMMEAAAEYVSPGFIQVICRNCTAVNETHYAPEASEVGGTRRG